MFALTIKLPPSQAMSGSCGAGPEGSMLNSKWQVGIQEGDDVDHSEHPHFFVKFPEDDMIEMCPGGCKRKKSTGEVSTADLGDRESFAKARQRRFSGRWSWIL